MIPPTPSESAAAPVGPPKVKRDTTTAALSVLSDQLRDASRTINELRFEVVSVVEATKRDVGDIRNKVVNAVDQIGSLKRLMVDATATTKRDLQEMREEVVSMVARSKEAVEATESGVRQITHTDGKIVSLWTEINRVTKSVDEVTDIVKKIEKRLDDLPVPKLVGSDIDWNAEESDLTPMPSQSSQSTTVSEASEVAGGRKPKRARVPSESVGTRKSTRARPANPRS